MNQMITHKQATEIIGACLMPNESFEDCYQVMKFCGEEIDLLYSTEGYNKEGNPTTRYWDLNNLWWDAASIYVPAMEKLNNQSNNKSH